MQKRRFISSAALAAEIDLQNWLFFFVGKHLVGNTNCSHERQV